MADERAFERAFFRQTADGGEVFFPWGLEHRGYRITDDATRRKASRAAGFLIRSVVAIGVGTAYVLNSAFESDVTDLAGILRTLAIPGAALALCLGGYVLRVTRLVERMVESDLVVTRDDRLREAAALADPRKIELIGVVTAAMSGLVIWIEPRGWWLGLLGVGVGVGLFVWGLHVARVKSDSG